MEFSPSQLEFFNSNKTVILSVLNDDMPIAIPIWGMIYQNAVYMATDADSLKLRLIDQHPKVSATVMKSPPGYPWMRIEGTATTGPATDFSEFTDFRDVVDRIATNYVGPEKAPERFPGDIWTIIKIQPTKIVGSVD